VALTLAALIEFDPGVWSEFFASTHEASEFAGVLLGGNGGTSFQSRFSIVRMWGGGIPQSYAEQAPS